MANILSSDASDFHDAVSGSGRAGAIAGAAGIFKAITTYLKKAHQTRVDNEVGQFLEQHGGQLTDDLERQISRRFGNQAGQW